jgi:hypothetical protein
MTEAEIMKALECCTDGSGKGIIRAVIDLINRKNAEIERLKKFVDDKFDRCIESERAYGRSEAIKEVLEKVKGRLALNTDISNEQDLSINFDLDQIAKEMGVEL